MADLSFRQRAAQQAATQLRQQTAQSDARQPFSLVIGSVSVALRVCIGKPCFKGPDGVEQRTATEHIVIALAMSNSDGAQPMRYEGWGNAESPGQASLTDDAGNTYPLTATRRGLEHWVGQVNSSRTLDPGKMISDVLVFGPPHHKATKLSLQLPKTAWGSEGVLRVDLPGSRIVNFPQPAN